MCVQKKFENETDPWVTKYALSPGEVLVIITLSFPDGGVSSEINDPDSQASYITVTLPGIVS